MLRSTGKRLNQSGATIMGSRLLRRVDSLEDRCRIRGTAIVLWEGMDFPSWKRPEDWVVWVRWGMDDEAGGSNDGSQPEL